MNPTLPMDQFFKIPSENIERAADELKKLQKRAVRLGVEPISFNFGPAITRSYPDPEHRPATWYGKNPETGEIEKMREPQRMLDATSQMLEVCGEAPKLADWTFLGVLDHTLPGATIIREVPGKTVPAEYRDSEPKCDHCQKVRRRNETFIVAHDDGRTMRVGRQCLKDFLGHKSPTAIASYFTNLFELLGSLSDPDGFGGFGYTTPVFELEPVLAMTARCIRAFGWVARSQDWDRQPTADMVANQLDPKWRAKHSHSTVCTAEQDEEMAKETIAWITSQDAGSNYMANLQALTKAGHIRYREFGLACSAVAVYQRESEKLRRAARVSDSQHVGEIKKRAEFTVTLLGIRWIDGMYGTTALHRMVDQDGNLIVWFASANSEDWESPMVTDKTYTVKATPKKHDEFRGTKQTTVTRLTVLKEVEVA